MRVDAWRETGRFFDFDGHPIFHRVEGEGPWLLLVHGFPTASWDWHRIWPALAARFRVLTFDLLGYGFSDKPMDHDYATAYQADLVEALLSHYRVDHVAVLAHDYGDTVVQELLARRQEGKATAPMVSVCLLNGGLFYEAIRPRPIQKILLSPIGSIVARLYNRRAFGRSMTAMFGPDTRPSSDDLDALWSLVTHDGGNRIVHRLIRYLPERAVQRDRWATAVTHSDLPIRFINGPADPVSGQAMVDRYRELVPDPDVVVLDRIGHFPQLEAPDAVTAALLEFALRV